MIDKSKFGAIIAGLRNQTKLPIDCRYSSIFSIWHGFGEHASNHSEILRHFNKLIIKWFSLSDFVEF